ncbi:MAG: hypothetical protein RLZZ357_415 [Bacteroidota bacterium]|jgi:hypothetical protein
MKKLIFVSFLVVIVNTTLKAQSEQKKYFLTTNVLSPFSGMNKNSAILNALLPVFSNLEYGFNLSGNLLNKYHFIDTRLSLGKSNAYNIIPQLQIGYNFLIIDYFKKNNNGFYIGANIRYWDYVNMYTKTQRHNVSPNIGLGYLWKKKKFIVDLRLNQSFAIFTKTNIDNSKSALNLSFSPMPELSPVLPFISINIGYCFKEMGNK